MVHPVFYHKQGCLEAVSWRVTTTMCYGILNYDQHNLQVSINTLINMHQYEITPSSWNCLPSRIWNDLDKFLLIHNNFGVLNTNSINSLFLLVFRLEYNWYNDSFGTFQNHLDFRAACIFCESSLWWLRWYQAPMNSSPCFVTPSYHVTLQTVYKDLLVHHYESNFPFTLTTKQP